MDTPTIPSFDFTEGTDDLENVIDFLKKVPKILSYVFDDYHFHNLLQEDRTHQLFFNAFNEAKSILSEKLSEFENRLDEDKEYKNNVLEDLRQIGFTNDSLKLKFTILESSWKDMNGMKISIPDSISSFFKKPVVKLTRRFLGFLNSIFGSLLKIFPGLESIKEIKEVGEHYASVAEEDIE